jgi:hypothetical protein
VLERVEDLPFVMADVEVVLFVEPFGRPLGFVAGVELEVEVGRGGLKGLGGIFVCSFAAVSNSFLLWLSCARSVG